MLTQRCKANTLTSDAQQRNHGHLLSTNRVLLFCPPTECYIGHTWHITIHSGIALHAPHTERRIRALGKVSSPSRRSRKSLITVPTHHPGNLLASHAYTAQLQVSQTPPEALGSFSAKLNGNMQCTANCMQCILDWGSVSSTRCHTPYLGNGTHLLYSLGCMHAAGGVHDVYACGQADPLDL